MKPLGSVVDSHTESHHDIGSVQNLLPPQQQQPMVKELAPRGGRSSGESGVFHVGDSNHAYDRMSSAGKEIK